MAKRALITGITGQDGAYLAKLLLDKGYKVYGTFRRLSTPNFWRLQNLGIFQKINLIPCDLADMSSILEAIKLSSPHEVYNLAAQSFVGAAFEEPIITTQVDGIAVAMFLEAIRHLDPDIKFYQASTSEMYGQAGVASSGISGLSKKPLDENSYFKPTSPYAAAKLYGYWVTKIYRQAYGLFACQGILFNHESPLRGLEFVTRKITNGVAKIALGLEKELHLGNMRSVRDWGYAPEYVEAMWRIMQHDEPDDFVIATNKFHSVLGFVSAAFGEAGLNWRKYTRVDKRYTRPIDTNALRGDYSKAEEELGWKPKTSFDDLVKIMVKADMERWQRVMIGESFPWDAPSYPSEVKIITRALKR
jgi:GDPmannose 4,6-dehydratase